MNTRLSLLILMLGAAAGATARAQSAPRAESTRVKRERVLIRLDSLLSEFDHAPLSAEESERLRLEMASAMRDMEPGMTYMRHGMTMTPGYLGVTFDGPSMEVP